MAFDKKAAHTPIPAPRPGQSGRLGMAQLSGKPQSSPQLPQARGPVPPGSKPVQPIPQATPVSQRGSASSITPARPLAPVVTPAHNPAPTPATNRPLSTRVERKPSSTVVQGVSLNTPLHHQLDSSTGEVPNEFRKLTRNQQSARATPARGIALPEIVPLHKTPAHNVSVPSPAASSTKIGWRCQRCRTPVDPKSLVENQAVMRDGLPLCAQCLKAERSQLTRKGLMLGAAAGLVLGSAVCLVFLFRGSTTAKPAENRILKDAEAAVKIAENGNIAEADRRVKALTARVAALKSPDAELEIITGKAEQALRARIKTEYGDISPKEEEVLMFVEGNYATPENQHPLRAVHVDDANNGTITVALTAPPMNNLVDGVMRSLPEDTLNHFDKLHSIKIHFVCGSVGATNEVGEIFFDRTILANMTRMPDKPMKIDPPNSSSSSDHAEQ